MVPIETTAKIFEALTLGFDVSFYRRGNLLTLRVVDRNSRKEVERYKSNTELRQLKVNYSTVLGSMIEACLKELMDTSRDHVKVSKE